MHLSKMGWKRKLNKETDGVIVALHKGSIIRKIITKTKVDQCDNSY